MKKEMILLVLLVSLLTSCGNNSFFKQKFTSLKDIKPTKSEVVEASPTIGIHDNAVESETKVLSAELIEVEQPNQTSDDLQDKEVITAKDLVKQDNIADDIEGERNNLFPEAGDVSTTRVGEDKDVGLIAFVTAFVLAILLLIAALVYALILALEGAALVALWPATIMSGIAFLIFATIIIMAYAGGPDLGALVTVSLGAIGVALFIPVMHLILFYY